MHLGGGGIVMLFSVFLDLCFHTWRIISAAVWALWLIILNILTFYCIFWNFNLVTLHCTFLCFDYFLGVVNTF